jgi:VCBS repeat-containing protein
MAAKTTAKVATLTGAAKDDVLGGGSEDATSNDLAVLANDPGAARLWSLDQGVPSLAGGTQVVQALGAFTLASGATISANADGTIHYDGSSVSLQYLAEGETWTDTFIYTVRMANGALSTASASVVVAGVNDIAVVSDDAGSVTEDATLTAGGTLSVTDADHDQSAFGTVGSLAGAYGDFTFDSGTGSWTYALRNGDANVQALNAGDVVYDTLAVASLDGTDTGTITVTINGADEPPPPPPPEPEDGGPRFMFSFGDWQSEHNVFNGFTDQDTLFYSAELTQGAVTFGDYDNDGNSDDAAVNFTYTGNKPGSAPVEIQAILIGVSFDPDVQSVGHP